MAQEACFVQPPQCSITKLLEEDDEQAHVDKDALLKRQEAKAEMIDRISSAFSKADTSIQNIVEEEEMETEKPTRPVGHTQRLKKLRGYVAMMGVFGGGRSAVKKYEDAYKKEDGCADDSLPKLMTKRRTLSRKLSYTQGYRPHDVRDSRNGKLLLRQNTSAKLKQKGFFRDLKKISKFFCILIGLWKKHALKVQEFLQTSVQLIDLEIVNEVMFDRTEFKSNNQSRLSDTVREALSKAPGTRTPEERRFIEIALRNYPELAAYPVRIQSRIAKRCWYERYTGRRIIIRQGHIAQCFYFVLSGSVLVSRIEPGSKISRTLCYLNRGDSFGELAFLEKAARGASCISEHTLELLVFGEEEFQSIFMSGGLKNPNDPILKCVPCLEDWPLEKLANNSQKAVSSYFRRGTCLVRDSTASNWIYVVRSGHLTVLKKLEAITPEKAAASIDLKRKKYNLKMDPKQLEVWMFNKFNEQERILLAELKANNHKSLQSLHLPSDYDPNDEYNGSGKSKRIGSADSFDSLQTHRRVLVTELKKSKKKPVQSVLGYGAKGDSNVIAPAMGNNFKLAATKNLPDPDEEDDIDHPVFVRIQKLSKGDVFGLAELVHDDQPSLSLVSNGAECIMIDKAFYMQHMSMDMIRKLRYEVSPFPSEEFIQQKYEAHVAWTRRQKEIVQVTRHQLDLHKEWRRGQGMPPLLPFST